MNSLPRKTAVVAIVVALAALPAFLNGYHRVLTGDDYDLDEKIVAALRHRDIPILIAHRGLDFFYTYRLRRDAFHFDPEPHWNRARIWRVAARITPEELAYYSPPSCPWGVTASLIRDTENLLVREDCWQLFRARLSVHPDENPDLYQEVWENMENPSQPRPAFLRARHSEPQEGAFPAFTGGQKQGQKSGSHPPP